MSSRRLTLMAGLAAVTAAFLAITTLAPVADAHAPGSAPANAAGTAGAGVQPSGIATFWGWLNLWDKTAATQPLAPYDQGNSAGGTNTVTYLGSGEYEAVFPNIGTSQGIVNVTVLGTKPRVCDVAEWDDSPPVTAGGIGTGQTENVRVRCFTYSGAVTRAAFSLAFLSSDQTTGRLAYVWAGEWTQTNYTQATWNFNSTGTPNTIHRNGKGDYRVTLPGLASAHGDVQVGNYLRFKPQPLTAVSPGGVVSSGPPSECNVASWGPHNTAMRVRVLCRDLTGHPIDSQFELTFTQNEGLKGPGASQEAYLFANRATSASYTPTSAFRYSSPAGKPHIKRSSLGTYSVSLPNLPKGGAVFVTAYGTGKVRCNVTSNFADGPSQKIGVHCRDFSGHSADAKFTLSYLR